MGWISPTSHNDPDNVWTNEPNAYDNNLNTFAQTNNYAGQNWLELILPDAIHSDKMRLYADKWTGYSHLDPNVKIDVYNGYEWLNVSIGVITKLTWVEIIFSEEWVNFTYTKARICKNFTASELRLHELQFNKAITSIAALRRRMEKY